MDDEITAGSLILKDGEIIQDYLKKSVQPELINS